MSRHVFLLVIGTVLALGSGAANAAQYTPFDVPNAYTTFPVSIDAKGAVAGTWQDNTAYAFHGFVRAADGKITTFDPAASIDTEVRGMNDKGTLVGRYQDSDFNVRGFIRKPNGKVVELMSHGIVAADSINGHGDLCGVLGDDQHVGHAFVRSANGKVSQIDPPGAIFGEAVGINDAGMVVGWFQDSGNVQHGFARSADGTISVFDPPDSHYTYVFAINAAGAVVGAYIDASGIPNGYIRDDSGKFIEFTLTNETGASTNSFGFNNKGAVVGTFYEPVEDATVTFERKPSGKIIKLKPPGSASTSAQAINNHGTIAGTLDVDGVVHGFLRTP